MSNVLLAYGNRTDVSTLSGGSFMAALPLTNLKNRVLGRVARTSNVLLASTQFKIDQGQDQLARVIALVNHNMSLTARYRIKASNNSDMSSPVVDTGWLDVWPTAYSPANLPWQAVNWWSCKYLDEDIRGFTWTLVHTMDASYRAQFWTVELDDSQNLNGYVQFGRLFIGDAWSPRINMSYGASLGWETRTTAKEALSGAKRFRRRTPFRSVRFSVDWLDQDEAFGNAFEIQRRMGVDGEVIFQYDPADTTHSIRRKFYGHLRTLSPIEAPVLNVNKTAFEVEELL